MGWGECPAARRRLYLCAAVDPGCAGVDVARSCGLKWEVSFRKMLICLAERQMCYFVCCSYFIVWSPSEVATSFTSLAMFSPRRRVESSCCQLPGAALVRTVYIAKVP